MRIRTCCTEYEVLHVEDSNEWYESFLCREVHQNIEYRLLCVKEDVIVPSMVSFLYEMAEKESFDDFVETFVFEEKLYIVLKPEKGKVLSSLLQEGALSVTERFELCENLLKFMMVAQIPLSLRIVCLSCDRVLVEDTLEIGFHYVLDGMDWVKPSTFGQYCNALSILLEEIFKDKLKFPGFSSLQSFINLLKEEKWTEDVEVFDAFRKAREVVSKAPKEELGAIPIWFYNLKCWWMKVRKTVRRVVAIFILVVVFFLVVRFLTKEEPDQGVAYTMHYIGTLKLEE